MPDTLKITLAQMNQSVGDLAGNATGMLAARDRAAAAGADLIAFPELQLIGYPPEDLVLKPSLVERAAAELQRMAEQTAHKGPAMLVGSVFVQDGALHNGVALLAVLLVLVTLVLYWPVTGFDFINYDDPVFVTANTHVQGGLNWEGVKWAFSPKEVDNPPLTWLPG